jgi:predicted O-methyltransferase YrrM
MTLHNTDALPPAWALIRARSKALGFDMASDADTGALLRTLAASRRAGRLLELGTGTGLATACLLAGMDAGASLISVDVDAQAQAVARAALGEDPRVTFVLGDGQTFIRGQAPGSFDLIFADAWPGKYEGLDDALGLLRPGGLYIGDDLLPQPNWPDGHQARVDGLIAQLNARPDLAVTRLDWATGIVIAVRTA